MDSNCSSNATATDTDDDTDDNYVAATVFHKGGILAGFVKCEASNLKIMRTF